MWSVVAGALAARRGQAIIVVLVAAMASAAIAVAPWYAVAAIHRVTVDTVAGAPAADRMLAVILRPEDDEPRPEDPAGAARQVFAPPDLSTVAGASATGVLRIAGGTGGADLGADLGTDESGTEGQGEGDGGDESSAARVAHREEVCAYLVITGSCPDRAGEVIVAEGLAEAAGLEIGDEVGFGRSGGEVHQLRIAGSYEIVDPTDPYWGTGTVLGFGGGAERHTLFASFDTVHGLEQVGYTYQLVIEPEALSNRDADELAVLLDDGLARLRAAGYAVSERSWSEVLAAVRANERNVILGIGVGGAMLLLLTWFTLAVVVRGAVGQLRRDVGWWRLHGVPSGRGWLVVFGQGTVPLVGGAVVGAAAGQVLGRPLLAGGPGPALATGSVPWLSLALAGAVVAGGLVVVAATQVGTLRTPVRDLLRRVPARGPRWRRPLADLAVVLVAAAAVGQALVVGREAQGVALLAPGLAVLAIALVAAWAVAPLAAGQAARALHAGRLATALVAASVARGTGTHRLFALVTVGVALLTAGFVGWDTHARTQQQRAALDVGAHQVLTVQVADPAQLLAAVRAADPAGTTAMAVVHRPRAGSHPPVLAVDTTRLGVVADWREEEYGGPRDQVAAALRPAAPAPVELVGDRLTVDVSGSDPTGADLFLRVRLRVLVTGASVEHLLGPLPEVAEPHQVAAPECVPGCRLVGFALAGAVGPDGERQQPQPGAQVELHRLSDADGPVAALADPTRWFPGARPAEVGPSIGTNGNGGLVLTLAGDRPTSVVVPPARQVTLQHSLWVFPVDAPVPLPVVSAGWQPAATDEVRMAPLPGAAVPAEVVGVASLLPGLAGPGVLVDLEYAQRLVPFPIPTGTAQVWLSPDASPSIVDDLRAAGVVPIRTVSLSDQLARLRSEGSAVGSRFQTGVAVIGLLLVAGAVLVFSVQERAGRAAELAALRAQGMRGGTVAAVAYGGLTSVVALAVLVGLAAGLVAALLAMVLHPGFVDGWQLLPAVVPRLAPVLLAVVATVAVLVGIAMATAHGLVRRTRRGMVAANGTTGDTT